MLEFIDQWIFIFTFIVIISINILLIAFNKKQLVITYSREIAIVLAFMQLAVWIGWNISNFLVGGWFHLLMTDLCPLISFVSIIVFLIHKEHFYKMLMPWLLIGALVTGLLGGGEFAKVNIEKGTFLYLRHTLMFLQGIFAYLWIGKYTKKELWQLLIFPLCLLAWIFLVGFIPWIVTNNIKWAIFSTGALPPSYFVQEVEYGPGLVESYGSYAIMGNVNLPYPVPTILFYSLNFGIALTIALSKKYWSIFLQKIVDTCKNLKIKKPQNT